MYMHSVSVSLTPILKVYPASQATCMSHTVDGVVNLHVVTRHSSMLVSMSIHTPPGR